MLSHKCNTPNSYSYLYRALVQGEKPFLYRKGVCLLLGVPGCEGGPLAFSPTMPAVGFRYLGHSFMTYSRGIVPPPRDPRCLHDSHCISSRDEQWWELERLKHKSTNGETQKDNGVPGIEAKEENSAEVVRESERIDIPGFSEKSVLFPLLTGESLTETETESESLLKDTPGKPKPVKVTAVESLESVPSVRPVRPVPPVRPVRPVRPVKESASGAQLQRRVEKPVAHPSLSAQSVLSVQSVQPVQSVNPVDAAGPEKSQEPGITGESLTQTEFFLKGTPGKPKPVKVIAVESLESVPSVQSVSPVNAAGPEKSQEPKITGKNLTQTEFFLKGTPGKPKPVKVVAVESLESVPSVRPVRLVRPVRPVSPVNTVDSEGSQKPKMTAESLTETGSFLKDTPGKSEPVKESASGSQLQRRLEKPAAHPSLSVQSVNPVNAPVPGKSGTLPGLLGSPADHDLRGVQYEHPGRVSSKSAVRIEQLRREVHRLNTLNARIPPPLSGDSADREIKGEDRMPMPNPLVPPVVDMHRSSPWKRSVRKIPCAFWERSFLGRFHLRILR